MVCMLQTQRPLPVRASLAHPRDNENVFHVLEVPYRPRVMLKPWLLVAASGIWYNFLQFQCTIRHFSPNFIIL